MKKLVLRLGFLNYKKYITIVLSFLLIMISGCQQEIDLTLESGLQGKEIVLSDEEKRQIIDYLSNYEFIQMNREGDYYGGAYYVVEYKIDGITHCWYVSGSTNSSCIEVEGDIINYVTYDTRVIHELSKYVK